MEEGTMCDPDTEGEGLTGRGMGSGVGVGGRESKNFV